MTSKTDTFSRTYQSASFGLAALAVAVLMLFASATESSAQIIKRSVQGGLLGAGIGAIAGGGKGAGKGAVIGAGVGAVVGAAEKSNRQHAAPPPPPPGHARPYPVANRSLVCDIQASLTRLGYQPGPVDCVFGRKTGDAIAAYEYNNQLPVTGQPSVQVHQHMISHGG